MTSGINKFLPKTENVEFTYVLPSPNFNGTVSVESVIASRRSRRLFIEEGITAGELSQILWAAYGITKPLIGYSHTRGGLKTAPSAGALYPLELYVVIGNVSSIEPGVYKYSPVKHEIVRTIAKDMRELLSEAAYNQEMLCIAAACILFSAIFNITTKKYGNRGQERYVYMDLGHSAQNVYLQSEALQLGTCAIGYFKDDEVKKIMKLPENEEPLYIMPVGHYFM